MAMTDQQGQAALVSLMPPPPARLPRPVVAKQVLDEDTYTEGIEAIIERDFFPDVPKMKSHIEWMRAVKSGDHARIKQAQINIMHRRAGLKTPVGAGTGARAGGQTTGRAGTGAWTTPTPGTQMLLRTPAMTPLGVAAGGETPGPGATPGGGTAAAAAAVAMEGAALRAPKMNLDTYMSRFTSEDNASFSKVVAEEHKRKRLKFAHHLDKPQQLLLTGPADTDEYGTTGQQAMTLAFTKHVPMTALYYPKDQVSLSDKEKAELAIGPPKSVDAPNTRLPGSELDQLSEDLNAGGAQPGSGFDRLGTPSFTPGHAGFSPLMTWGELGSTPLRLEGTGPEDFEIVMAPGAGTGPFQVQELGSRERVLHRLAHSKAGTGVGGRRASPALTLLQQAQGRARTPLLSPAARALATRLKAGTPTAAAAAGGQRAGQKGGAGTGAGAGAGAERDEGLRASYRRAAGAGPSGTPVRATSGARHGSRATTPLVAPAPPRPAATATAAAGAGGAAVPKDTAPAPAVSSRGASITDDLLQL